MRTITSTSLEERGLSVGLISDHLHYRRLKKYLKKLERWERQMMEAGLPPMPPDFNIISKGKENDTERSSGSSPRNNSGTVGYIRRQHGAGRLYWAYLR